MTIKYFMALLILFFSSMCLADDVGYRLNSIVPSDDTAIVQFPPGGTSSNGYISGKTMQFFYDHDFSRNFYLEGALGYRSPSDIFEYSSAMYEISPGVKVEAGPLITKFSIGGSYMPQNQFNPDTWEGYNKTNFVIHFGIGLKDPKTGVAFMLERTHYSNGYSDNNPSLDYAGFTLSIPVN